MATPSIGSWKELTEVTLVTFSERKNNEYHPKKVTLVTLVTFCPAHTKEKKASYISVGEKRYSRYSRYLTGGGSNEIDRHNRRPSGSLVRPHNGLSEVIVMRCASSTLRQKSDLISAPSAFVAPSRTKKQQFRPLTASQYTRKILMG